MNVSIKRKADPKIPNSTDIHCEIQPVPFAHLSQMKPGEPSAAIRDRVIRARKIQEERFKPFPGTHCNAQMNEKMLHQFAEPSGAAAFCANAEKYIEVSGSPIKFITVIENGAGKNGTMSLTKE